MYENLFSVSLFLTLHFRVRDGVTVRVRVRVGVRVRVSACHFSD